MSNKTKMLAFTIAIVFLFIPVAFLGITNMQHTKPQLSPETNPIRVACVGDSITEITGYPSDLQSMLGSNYSVGNFGVTGSTVLLNSWEPYMNQTAFQKAEDFDPQIVIVMLGTNDDLQSLQPYNDSFEGDYATLINSFMQLPGDQQIYVATSPPILSNDTDLNPAYLNNVLIPKTQDLANQMNLTTINVHDAFGNNPAYFREDGIHPNSDGAQIIASQVYNAIISGNNQTNSIS